MHFEDFWKKNRERYLKIAELNVKLAINTAAEEAWDAERKIKCHYALDCDYRYEDISGCFVIDENNLLESEITTEDEKEQLRQPPFARG